MARPSKLYLVCYNSLQALGWFIALLRLLPCLAHPVSAHSAYAVAGDLICFLQTCAILETVHAAIGLVPTAPLLTVLQWGGRTHFVLAVVRQIPQVQSSPSVFITFMAWSIAEVIRYSHYALTTLKVCPSWVTYLSVDYVPSSPICEEEEPLLRFLREVLHELSFISSGCAGVLSIAVAEAVLACVQATQVKAGKGEQEETSLRKLTSSAQM
ncbi:very-long-chain (3R)-3-hydroxyacyl-CoA dehydratase 2 isoform X2 [Setaria italica]|uniref:very-long-chain (3R)-3-hydroxyacyl-CoA dehydratase 2 isoform X2 n=1 Tax=Setaria italica TaxID=4555 RepID=UPI000350D77C|nr:very-long-chain (3R)-3-hydroxyacyl-CoA dehydratase 2 isoform X2 [Setaria italica]